MSYQTEFLRNLASQNRVDDIPELETGVFMTHYRPHLFQRMERIIMSQTQECAIHKSEFEKPPDLSEGKYYIANTEDGGKPILVIEKEVTHLLVGGKTEIGKTAALYNLIDQIVRKEGTVWIVEMSKKEAKNFIRINPSFNYIPLHKLKQNIYGPYRGLGMARSNEVNLEIICSITGLMTASSSYSLRIQDELGKLITNGRFSLPDMLDFMRTNQPKRGTLEFDYWERINVRLEKANRSGGSALSCSRGFPVDMMEESNLIIQGTGTDLEIAELRLTRLILETYFRRLTIPQEKLKPLFICIDDAHLRLFDRDRDRYGANLLTQLPNISRAVKMIFLIGTQSPKSISDSIFENSSKLLMNLTDSRDQDLMARSMGLTREQKEYCYDLKTGEGVLKLISDRWIKPMPIRIPFFEIPHDVSDEEAEEHSKDFIEELNRYVEPRSNILLEKLKRDKIRDLKKEEEVYLIHILNNPFLNEAERKVALGLSNYMSNSITKGLVVKGHIVKRRFHTGKPGNQPVLQELTWKAKNYLKSIGVRIPAIRGKGGIVHQNWARIISEYWKGKSMETFIEPSENGANTDVLIIDAEGNRTAVEIALSSKNQVYNIQRDLKHFDKVIMTADTEILLEKIKAEASNSINGNNLNRVKFCILRDFLN